MENVLEVHKLAKNYGAFKAVDEVSFVVPKGKVIGLLGPNGAGKSTTINMLLGITTHSAGTIKYFGRNFEKDKPYCLQRINYTSAYNSLQGRVSIWENLIVYAMLYNVPNPNQKIEEVLEYFEISSIKNQRFWDLSAGQKTRANLAKSLLNDPDLILMDEPTASLDPDIADKTLSLIEKLRETRGLSILFTSHDMDEVTRICDEVIFLQHGQIVAQDTPVNLTKMVTNTVLRLVFAGAKAPVEAFAKKHKLDYEFEGKNTILINTEEHLAPKIILSLGKGNIDLTDIEINKPTLEDVFLQIARTGRHVPNE